MEQEQHCKKCGVLVNEGKLTCPNCGSIQDSFKYRSRIAASTLAIFGGVFGAHRFFLGQWWGIFYLLFCWTYIPWIVGIIEGIVFLSTSQDKWNDKYNKGISAGSESGVVVIIFAAIIPFIFITAILVALALPAYQDYTIRTKIAEGASLSAVAKLAVSEYVLSEQEWPIDNAAVGLSHELGSNYVTSLKVDDGVIYVEFSPGVGTTGALVFVPSYSDGKVSWSCKESTIKPRHLPSSCRP